MQNLGILATAAAPAPIVDTPIPVGAATFTAPTFRQFARRLPDQGLMLSFVLHCSFLALLPLLARPLYLVPRYQENLAAAVPLVAPDPLLLPALGDIGGPAGSSSKAGASGMAHGASSAPAYKPPKAKFAGPQEIISDPPDATNELQTIRRPDIVKPIKIKNPVRLKSMVQIPAPALKLRAAPPQWLMHPPTDMPVKAEITSHAPAPVKEAALKVRRSEARPKVVDVPPPSVAMAKQNAPELPAMAGNAPTLAKAVVVVNAVEPPPGPPTIPDAELSGRFSVAPLDAKVSAPAASGSANGVPGAGGSATASGAGNGSDPAGKAGNGGSSPAALGSGSGVEGTGGGSGTAGSGPAARGATGVGTGDGTGSGSAHGSGNGAGTHEGNSGRGNGGVGSGKGTGLPGISISGGSGSGHGGLSINSGSSPSYNLTIIAAGSNGGASRDLGVFGRSETVHTVYLSMRDSGGGPDWPLQYALPQATLKGVLTPPFPTKQVSAVVDHLGFDTSPVFIAGEIDADGKLGLLHAARASDTRSAAAIAALAKWEFTPAKLDGKPVATKVLIGVQFVKSRPK